MEICFLSCFWYCFRGVVVLKKTVSVDVDKIPDEFKSLVKPEMTLNEVSMLGNVIFKMKVERFKTKLKRFFYGKRFKRETDE